MQAFASEPVFTAAHASSKAHINAMSTRRIWEILQTAARGGEADGEVGSVEDLIAESIAEGARDARSAEQEARADILERWHAAEAVAFPRAPRHRGHAGRR